MMGDWADSHRGLKSRKNNKVLPQYWHLDFSISKFKYKAVTMIRELDDLRKAHDISM